MFDVLARDAVQFAVIAVAIGAAVIKLVQLTRGPLGVNRPAVAAMCGAIITMAIAVTQEVPSVTAMLNAALGHELGYAQRHTPALLSFFFLRTAFLCWVWPPGRVRRRRLTVQSGILVGVLAARWILALCTPAGEAALALRGYWTEAPWTTPAMLLYTCYMVATIGSIIALALLWASTVASRRRWTAIGLRLIAAGGVGYELYLGHKVVFLIVQVVLGQPPYDQVYVEWYVLIPSTLLLMLGLAVPLVATGLPAAVHLARQRAAYGQLGPLWMALTGHQPEVVLSSRPGWVPSWLGELWDGLSLRELGFRLYRRVIECWDITVGLHGYLDSRLREAVYEQALGRVREETEARAIAEAVMIRTALDHAVHEESFVPEEHRAHPRDTHPELTDNVSWWLAVARAWAHPLTAALSPPLRQLP